VRCLLAILPSLLGCQSGKFSSDQAAFVAVNVFPETASLHTSPAGGDVVDFTAEGVREDGSRVELDNVEWILSNRSVGAIDETGTVTPSLANGGASWVTARFAGLEGLAELAVEWSDTRIEGDADPGLFTGESQPIDNLWLYPEDGVNLPRNLPSLVFQWNDVSADAYRLHFRGASTDLTVYTRGTSWTADEALWQTITATNAGGTVRINLEAYAGGVRYAATSRTVHVNRFDNRGSIYYWSSSASGIMRVPWAGSAEPFLTAGSTGRCVGCHSISPTGVMAVTYDGGNGPMGLRDLSTGADINAGDGSLYGNFKAFSPDGRFMAVVYAGALRVHDANTGAALWDVAVGESVTHVDWSPDGTMIAMTATSGNHPLDWVIGAGRIVVMDHLGDGTFGPARTLYAAPTGQVAYYPAFSPDGAWVAFNLSAEDGYDDATAQLWVASVDGSVVLPLTSANHGEGLYNSWPRWGPLPDDDIMWLAFSSRRTYGNRTSGNPQVWITAFDGEAARAGGDPSWPAFWLPGQDPGQGNHIPMWVE
jgi:hypothetical protein